MVPSIYTTTHYKAGKDNMTVSTKTNFGPCTEHGLTLTDCQDTLKSSQRIHTRNKWENLTNTITTPGLRFSTSRIQNGDHGKRPNHSLLRFLHSCSSGLTGQLSQLIPHVRECYQYLRIYKKHSPSIVSSFFWHSLPSEVPSINSLGLSPCNYF